VEHLETGTLLTPVQAAARLGLRVSTLARWRWSGKGPPFHRIGGRIAYAMEDVIAFVGPSFRSTSEADAARLPR